MDEGCISHSPSKLTMAASLGVNRGTCGLVDAESSPRWDIHGHTVLCKYLYLLSLLFGEIGHIFYMSVCLLDSKGIKINVQHTDNLY